MFEKSVDIFILSLVLSYGNCEREGLVDKKRRGESCTAVRIFIYRERKKFGKRLGRLLRLYIYIYIFVGRTSEEAPCTALASKHDTQP